MMHLALTFVYGRVVSGWGLFFPVMLATFIKWLSYIQLALWLQSFESMQVGLCLYTLFCSTNMFTLISILQSWLLYIFIKDETHSLSPLTLYSFVKVVLSSWILFCVNFRSLSIFFFHKNPLIILLIFPFNCR